MTVATAVLLFVVVAMAVLFVTERVPSDLVAFMALVTLIVSGHLRLDEAFAGFASPAVVTLLSMFVVGASLVGTGMADAFAGRVLRGNREPACIAAVVLVGGLLSMILNNLVAAAVAMPLVATLATRTGLPYARVFIPLSFGVAIGGAATLVGSTPNIVAGTSLSGPAGPVGILAFTPAGVLLLGVAAVFLATVGRRLLPTGGTEAASESAGALLRVYRLREQLFSLRLPTHSELAGTTLGSLGLGADFGVQVVAIVRGGERFPAPSADMVLRGEDTLLLRGPIDEIEKVVRVQGVDVQEIRVGELPRPLRGVSAARARIVAGSTLHGQSLRTLRFRERFGVIVVGIERGEDVVCADLPDAAFQDGDRLLVVGTKEQIAHFSQFPQFKVSESGLAAVRRLKDLLYLIHVHESSPLAGATLGESRMGELVGLTIGGIVRDNHTRLGATPDERIEVGDALLVAGEPWRIVRLLEYGDIRVEPELDADAFASRGTVVAEAVLAPQGGLPGRTLRDLAFRERYGLQVLAVWRAHHPIRNELTGLRLRFGDALLVQGPRERVDALSMDPDFVVATDRRPPVRRRGWVAVAAVIALLVLAGFGVLPVHIAALVSAVAVVVAGALDMTRAYRVVDWRTVFMVAALLPVGAVLERAGAMAWLADALAFSGPWTTRAAIIVVTGVFALLMGGIPAIIVMAPTATLAATAVGGDPRSFLIGASLAASTAIAVPRHDAPNRMVQGLGGYRRSDYIRVGLPLTIILLLIMTLLP